MTPEDRTAHERDARLHYWRRFPVTVQFTEPCRIVGRVIQLADQNTATGPVPKIKIRQEDGFEVYVIAYKSRLLAALVDAMPVVGDDISITYRGEAPRGAPSSWHEFTVRLRPPAAQEAS